MLKKPFRIMKKKKLRHGSSINCMKLTHHPAFRDEYNLKALQKIKTSGFEMFVTPRYLDHYITHEYEPFSTKIIETYVKDGSTFVDVGAHYGYYSLLAVNRKKNIRIIAVEPVKENFRILEKNLSLYQIASKKTYNAAASNRNGREKFHVTEASDSAGFYEHPLTATKKIIYTQTVKLDSILKNQRVDFVKIDVEGHEIHVLRGLQNTIKRNPKLKILIEFTPKCQKMAGFDPSDMLQELKNLGFELFLLKESEKTIHRLTNQIDHWEKIMAGLVYANIFCVPKKQALYTVAFSHMSELGGAERSLNEWTTELQKRDALVTVVLPQEGTLKKELESHGVSCMLSTYPWWCWTLGGKVHAFEDKEGLSKILRLFDSIKEMDPHLILTNTIVIPWGAYVASYLKKPHIWTICEFGEKDHGFIFLFGLKQTIRFILSNTSLLITVSKAIYEELFSGEPHNIPHMVLYPKIQIKKRKTLSNNFSYYARKKSTKLLILQNIMPSKGQEDAVRMAIMALDSGMNIELAVVGPVRDETYEKNLQQLAKGKKYNASIRFFPFTDDYLSCIEQADIVLVCSKNESLGRVTMESMFMGKLVIGSQAGGTIELLNHGKTGLLYKPGNVTDLLNKVRYAYQHKNEAVAIGRRAKRFAETKFSTDNAIDVLYQRMLRLKGKTNSSRNNDINTRYLITLLNIVNQSSQKELNTKENNDALKLQQELDFVKQELVETKKANESNTLALNRITSAKVFRIWQYYCKIRDKLLHGKNG